MNTKPDDRRVRKTKKALRQGLAILMERKNIKDITVRELTDLMDMHRGTFYLHYRDIYDLQEHIENDIISEVTQILDEFKPVDPGDSPQHVLLALMNYITENKEMCQALLSNNSNQTFIEKLSAILQMQTLHLMEQRFHTEQNKRDWEYFLNFLISGYIAVIRKWTETGMMQSPEEMAVLLSSMGMYGIKFAENR